MNKLLAIIAVIMFCNIPVFSQLTIGELELSQHLDSLKHYKQMSIPELTTAITAPYGLEEDKVLAVSYWISKHIRYDDEGLKNNYWFEQPFDSTLAIKVLQAGKGICGGYAILAKEMYNELDIESQIVTGIAKGTNYTDSDLNENHAWNLVRLDSSWQIFDLTWASPKNESSSVNFYYFNPNPRELISTHLPTNSDFNLLEESYSIAEFLLLPRARDLLYEYKIAESLPELSYSDSSIVFELNKYFEGSIGFIIHEKGTYNSDIIEYMSIDKENSKEIHILLPDNKKYNIEMTYISEDPMEKHFEVLTFGTR